MDLREKVHHLPVEPGVYLYKDAQGKVIYVGKAKSLRARVRTYFSDDHLERKSAARIRFAVLERGQHQSARSDVCLLPASYLSRK